jgi:hypothetical protein
MGFKKGNWQIWYFLKGIDKVWIDIETLNITSIGRIMGSLELK